MNGLTDQALRQLVRVYMVANTPAYLYRKLLSEESVAELAAANSVEQLIDFILRVDESQERSVEDVAGAYGAVVALTLKDSQRVIEALEDVRLENLEWVEAVLRIWDSERIPTVTKEGYPPPSQQDPGREAAPPTWTGSSRARPTLLTPDDAEDSPSSSTSIFSQEIEP